MTVFIDLIMFIITFLACLVMYFKWKYSYWRKKNIHYVQPRIPFGTSENPFIEHNHQAVEVQKYYRNFKLQGYPYGGLYLITRPSLLVVDVEFIKNIFSKDFQYFTDRGMYYNEKHDPLSANLFNLEGPQWRHLRAKLTPTFTSGKIKMMFPTLIACSDPLCTYVDELCQTTEPVDIKDALARFTTDVIGSCAFGIECNSFKEAESDFRKYGKLMFTFSSKLLMLKAIIAFSNPALAKRLNICITQKEVSHFFLGIVRSTVAYRAANKIIRQDFMQLLMDLKTEDGDGDPLTIEQIAAQSFVFFFAGFETSSTTMTFCLYELAVNQDIQNKLRDEINTILDKYNGNVTYDAVMEMKYLSQVIDETLRKYPPVSVLFRVCVQDYRIPDTNVVLDKGTHIVIPIYSLHHDADYFPNPDKFDPERFNNESSSNIRPFTYVPFGEGPRICIGLRFGLLQAKVGLLMLLKNFRFLLNKKTQFPLKFVSTNFILEVEGGVWLDVEKI